MSDNGPHKEHTPEHETATETQPAGDKAAATRLTSDDGFAGVGGFAAALPLFISLGGALAAGLASSALSADPKQERRKWREQHDADDDTARSWLAAGAKAAGVAGVLKAIGTGNVRGAAATAAKAYAAKKVAAYAADAASRGYRGRDAARKYARLYAREGYGRGREALHVIRHGQRTRPEAAVDGPASAAVTGVVLLTLGAAAAYLFDRNHGEVRRQKLRESALQLIGKVSG